MSSESVVKTGTLSEDAYLPLVISAALPEADVIGWVKENLSWLQEKLLFHGALLFRGFRIASLERFEEFMRTAVNGTLLDYSQDSTPRTKVQGKVYTSTEYPASETIPMHNEMSYCRAWPLKIWFYCEQAAEVDGETPLADSRQVYERLDPTIVREFESRGVMYVRNFGTGLDIPWQKTFHTNDKAVVEQICRRENIEFKWFDGDRLRVCQVCQATARHPDTHQPVWFNQAHLFHNSSLEEHVREMLLEELTEEGLPRNSYYGDGRPIDDEVIAAIREAYDESIVQFAWQNGDVLMLDNMLTAHGRRPYTGRRVIHVGMAQLYS